MSHSGEKRPRDSEEGYPSDEDERFEASKVDLTIDRRELVALPSQVLHADQNTEDRLGDMDTPNLSQASQLSQRTSHASQESTSEGYIPLDGCTEELSKSFMTVSPNLRNQGEKRFKFPFDVYMDPNKLLLPAEQHFNKMAAVSKGFKLKRMTSTCRLTQPTEGTPLTFVAECSGPEIPKASMRVMYFAQRLKQYIDSTGLQGFVVPTDNLTPQYDVTGKHIVCMMEKRRPAESDAAERDVSNESDLFSLEDMLVRRERNQTFIEDVPKEAISVRVGFTCTYSKNLHGLLEKRMFCIVVLTPINSFDLLSYIKQTMLKAPSKGSADFEARNRDYNEMLFLWRLILDNEAYNSMCLPGHLGDPINEPPSGRVGLDSITSEFMIPLKINAMIRAASPGSYEVEIIGFPYLTFRKDDMMNDYREYADAIINEVFMPVKDFVLNFLRFDWSVCIFHCFVFSRYFQMHRWGREGFTCKTALLRIGD